jgi:dolichyl-phosphate beta-glucosyltransferase
MDGDLAYSLEHLELLVEKIKELDVVIGCRNLERGNF